jgi:hypothetical protein
MGETAEHEPAPQPPGAASGQAGGAFDGGAASTDTAAEASQLPRPSATPDNMGRVSGMSRLVSGFSNLSRVASGVSAASIQRQISARAPLDVEKLGDDPDILELRQSIGTDDLRVLSRLRSCELPHVAVHCLRPCLLACPPDLYVCRSSMVRYARPVCQPCNLHACVAHLLLRGANATPQPLTVRLPSRPKLAVDHSFPRKAPPARNPLLRAWQWWCAYLLPGEAASCK